MNNKALRNRKRSTVDNDALVGVNGEVIVLPDESTIAVHDGVNPGGTRLSKEDSNFTSVHQHADATGSAPGFMSAADKTKLDGLSAQALPPASSQNAPNTLVRRDGNGDFAANVVTASSFVGVLNGAASSISGNLTGDVTSTGMTTVLSTTGVAAGTYGSSTQVARITVDAKGRVTSAQNIAISGGGASGAAGGDLGGTYPNPTVESVGTRTKAQIAQSVLDTINATSAGTASTLAKRDASGKLQSGLTQVGDPAATLATKGYVDAFSGGSKSVAVFRRNPGTGNQEVSINGTAFTTSGATSFSVPVSVSWFGCVIIGAGGGGSGASTSVGGNGGGAGAYIFAQGVPVLPGSTLTVTVGAGGAGGTGGATPNASSGGSSSISGAGLFMGTMTAGGGGGATSGSYGNGASWNAGWGLLNVDGAGLKYVGGYYGGFSLGNTGGGGGSCFTNAGTAPTGAQGLPGLAFGPGAGGNGASGTTGVTVPSNGSVGGYGAGGGGGARNGDLPSYSNGGKGGDGLVVIFY